jgi:hypothetical protein
MTLSQSQSQSQSPSPNSLNSSLENNNNNNNSFQYPKRGVSNVYDLALSLLENEQKSLETQIHTLESQQESENSALKIKSLKASLALSDLKTHWAFMNGNQLTSLTLPSSTSSFTTKSKETTTSPKSDSETTSSKQTEDNDSRKTVLNEKDVEYATSLLKWSRFSKVLSKKLKSSALKSKLHIDAFPERIIHSRESYSALLEINFENTSWEICNGHDIPPNWASVFIFFIFFPMYSSTS